MAGLLLVIVACLSASVALAARLARARRPATVLVAWAALPAGVTRRTAGWRWAGVIGGLVAGSAAAGSGALGRGLLLAAPVFGLFVLAGVVVGETSVRSPGGRTRIAALEVRRVRDYLPRGLARAVIAAAAVLLALLIVTTATGAPDDLGRPGRILLLQCSAALQQGAGPWPGSFYSVPLAAMVVVGLIAAGAALGLSSGGHALAQTRLRSRRTTPCGIGPPRRSPAPAASWSPFRWLVPASLRRLPCCPCHAARRGGPPRDGPSWRCCLPWRP
jgi:hypothetical protein